MKTISKEHISYSFSPFAEPALTVQPGECVCFETHDCYRNQLQVASVGQTFQLEGINPVTGFVAVQGAEPGDTLKISVLAIELDQAGSMYLRPGAGALKRYVTQPEVKKLKVSEGAVHFGKQRRIPVQPMIGVIGVAPKEKEISTLSPGPHGGNLDTREITAGSILYFPVFVQGAKLAIGDLHAVMGDGEVAVCGVEISGRVHVKIELLKQVTHDWPVLEDERNFYVLASAPTLDEAAQEATESMFRFLRRRDTQLSDNDIICLMGLTGDLRISQVVNPLKTAKFAVPKEFFHVTFQ